MVIAKNAANIIERNLKSLNFVDELILVDIKSSDETVKKAKKFTKNIYQFTKDSSFVELVRNFAIKKASKDWILVLDADEEIPLSLAKKLKELSETNLAEAYYLPRKNMVFGAWIEHTNWWPDYQLRFFKQGTIEWGKKIHSQPLFKGQKISSQTSGIVKLEAREEWAMIHHNYQTIEDYLLRLNRYTNIEAEQKMQARRSISNASLMKDFSDEWFSRLFAGQGYKDGARGFYLSCLQAVYQMSVEMKIWEKNQFSSNLENKNQLVLLKELKKFQKDLNFWISDLEIRDKRGLARIWASLKRKIKL